MYYSPEQEELDLQTSLEELSEAESFEECNQRSYQSERCEGQSNGGGQLNAVHACESLCCQDTLDLYQVKDSHIVKKTRVSKGH